MKKSLGAMGIAIFVACTVGAVPPSWGGDSGAAGFSCVSPPSLGNDSGAAGFSFGRPTTSFLSNLSLSLALGNDSGAAGFSFGRPTTSLLSTQPLSSTRTPSLGHPAGAVGLGSISSGMVYQGFNGAGRVSYEQHSSASGSFSFSASYKYESQFPSSGITDLFSGFFSFP
jgi:hypothetical protein